MPKESKLGDTTVLDLYVMKTVETFLVSIIKKSKRIKESKWWLESDSKTLRAVEVFATLEGVKAATEATRVVAMASFILDICFLFCFNFLFCESRDERREMKDKRTKSAKRKFATSIVMAVFFN